MKDKNIQAAFMKITAALATEKHDAETIREGVCALKAAAYMLEEKHGVTVTPTEVADVIGRTFVL